jgi:hypothetical protein
LFWIQESKTIHKKLCSICSIVLKPSILFSHFIYTHNFITPTVSLFAMKQRDQETKNMIKNVSCKKVPPNPGILRVPAWVPSRVPCCIDIKRLHSNWNPSLNPNHASVLLYFSLWLIGIQEWKTIHKKLYTFCFCLFL